MDGEDQVGVQPEGLWIRTDKDPHLHGHVVCVERIVVVPDGMLVWYQYQAPHPVRNGLKIGSGAHLIPSFFKSFKPFSPFDFEIET